MKSLCIKTNDSNLLDYLLNELNLLDINDVCFCQKKFKHFNNIIIHYRGKNTKDFICKLSSILSFLVIDELEERLIKNIILKDYFYFDKEEMDIIYNTTLDLMSEDFSKAFINKWNILYNTFENWIKENKSIYINGFVQFRIKPYLDILDEIVCEAVNCYVVEKEYNEFISLLKLYISSQSCTCKKVHLLYSNSSTILLDENKNVIPICDDIFKSKYLSDISFSANDYTLNTLLSLLPEEIEIHLINTIIDEFINTLQLIFEDRVTICNSCPICSGKTISSKLPII